MRITLMTLLSCGLFVCQSAVCTAQNQSRRLTDSIQHGQGNVNLLKDMNGQQLGSYLAGNSNLYLGIDIRETTSGLESSDSLGLAIKHAVLTIETSLGTFSFSDIFTNTVAGIMEQGAAQAETYHVLFGMNGNNALNSDTSGFNLGQYDDVLVMRDVSVNGNIQSARLDIRFLDVATQGGGANGNFFDFSGGVERVAMLSSNDAVTLDAADKGITQAPSQISFQKVTQDSPSSAPGSPAPPLGVLALLGAVGFLRKHVGNLLPRS